MPDSLHAFVGSVGLAGMDGSLWAVEGGNKYILTNLSLSPSFSVPRMVTVCASMLAAANMYHGAVTEITRAGPGFTVRIEHEGSPDTVRRPLIVQTLISRTNKRPVFISRWRHTILW